MRVYANQLQQNLNQGLKPVYLVFGEEPLQKIEAIDQIRHTAKAQGFVERQSFSVNSQFNFDELFASFNELSLFASQKIIELEIENGKPGQSGSKALVELVQVFNPDTLLVIHGGKLEASVTKTKWFKTMDSHGVYVPTYNIDANRLPRWIEQRAKSRQVILEPAAVQLLAEFYAGNLLALAQEIDKLAISYQNNTISAPYLQSVILNQSRYNVFQLVDELLAGKIEQAITILLSLQQEALEPTIINWALSREAIQLFEMKTLINNGMAQNDVFSQYKVWSSKQALYNQALQRMSLPQLEQLVFDVQQVDKKLKSFGDGNAYTDFCHICLCFEQQSAKALKPFKLSQHL